MIDLSKYGLSDELNNITLSDLIVLSNIEKTNIDTSVVSVSNNRVVLKGKQSNKIGSYAIIGCEIVKILEQSEINGDTEVVVEKELFGTVSEEQTIGVKFRTVVPLTNPIQLINWEFNDTMGSIGTTVFPVELGSGKIEIKDDPKKWMQFSMDKIYSIKNKKSMAFIFKGVNDKCVLKHATVIDKVGFNTKGKRDPNMISLTIKTVLAKWYEKDLAINQQIKSCEPKEFFQMIFGLEAHDVYYADGVTADSFVKIGNMHTKEYKKISELLKAYASCGVRFCFDRYERVKVFSDMKVDNIKSQKTLKYNITDTMMDENSLLVFNKIDTNSFERQTMFDFDELNNEYVHFAGTIPNAIMSDRFISVNNDGDYTANSVEIIDEKLFSAVQLKDYVLFKQTVAPYLEIYGRVGAKETGNKVQIFTILQGDKDYKLFYTGKAENMYKTLNNNVRPMNLHYARFDLPMIWRYTRGNSTSDSTKYNNQMLPLLPRVDGETKYETEISMSFGSASNLEVGEYSGFIEEINGIYGTWDSSKLLYNQEKTQFSGKSHPPIFALSNIGNERIVENQPMLFFDKFDNSNLLLEITKNEESSSSNDGKLVMSNTMNANSSIDIYEGEELSRLGNRILQVSNISPFKVGDILVVKNFDNPTSQESKLFDEKLSKLRYRITNKTTEVIDNNNVKHWITLDNNYPPLIAGKKWKFQRFPVDKIVYLQELYFRGNPVIQFSQEVSGFSKATNSDGDTSKDIYGDKAYSFDSKLLEKDGVKMLMGYVLDHFNGTSPMTTKYTLPVSVANGIDIELFDVVTVIDTVFTYVGENIKWLVVGAKTKAKTNVVELSLINLHATNTKPYDIDINDVIEFSPVEIPEYDFAGGEGSSDGENGGEGGTDEDKALGVVALSEVKREELRARIERFDGNYVYFKDFSGTKWEEYEGALFPNSEFAINVEGEIVFVESDRKHRAFVKKRMMYDTEEAVIIPELEVGFYVVSTMVGIDGTFYSRKTHIGDGKNYFKFDINNGAKFVGDFVVGENNQNAGNDLWESLQKNKTFYQNIPPMSDSSYTLRDGDLWYDLDDENHTYRYNGDVWVSCRDKSIISTQSSSFLQPDPPVATEGRPINNGDTWYDTDDGNKPYVYKDGEWISVTDKNLEDAINDAQNRIDGTMSLLSDIASDNKFTPSEKQAVKKEWDIIVAEYPQNIAKANAYGVLTTNYTSKYNTLKSYIEPLLSNLTTTSDIVGTTFRTNFKNYYTEEMSLTGSIYDKVKENAVNESKDYADKIDAKVESYASDGVLTPSEKADLKSEVETIEGRATILKSRASVFGVSVTTLTNYVTKLTNWKNGVLSQAGNYEDKAQIQVLKTDFKNYYIEEEKIYDGIEKKAKELADKAQTDANGALGLLSDIASDNKFTPSEKQAVKKEWDIIVAEYPKIYDEAVKFGVSKTNYANSYSSLKSYIEPLLSNINTTSDINGETFRTNFKNYYTDRQIVLNSLNDAIKNSAITSSKDYADTVIGALGKDLENQIDGKINTYNQETDPSSSWSATDKTKNTGDLWYKPSEKVTRRWTGSAWQVLDAKDTVAQALAQSKRRVFTAQPTVPYDAGDLWVTNLSSTGDMMICVTTRTTGSYTASEWKKATKYTDDTKANEALQNANNAQISANGVQSQVDEMASDNKLSPIEKQQTKKEWEIILAEYPQNIAKANAYSVTTTTYTNAYNTLKSYVEPLISNLTTTSDIVGTTFRANFKSYYDAEIKLTGSIYDKVKESAITNDNANRIINSELKDLNLWTHSMTSISHSGEDSRPEAGGSNGYLTLTNTTGAERYLYSPRFQLEAGTYTISLGLHGDSLGTTADLFILGSTTALSTDHSNKGYTTVVASNTPTISASWKRVSFTFTAPSGLKSAVLRIDNNGGSGTRVVHVNTIKLEKGSVATPWTKCPLDNKYYADKVDAKVESYASDGVLTPSEKADLKSEIETIEGASTTLKSRATLFGVSVTTLTSYVTTLTNWKTILSQAGNYTDATQITKLRTDFKNYYIEEEKVYDGIEKKAKELADKAQTDANGALGLLTDIASDNKFTPSEKQSVKKEWDIIVSEYAKNIAEAKVYGVDYTSHTTTYNALNSYITPLLSNLTTTSDIVGTTFRANFKNYYDSRTDLLTKISAKTLEIGFMQNGKMLYLDPTFKKGLNGINRYDNSGSGLISISRVTGSTYGKTPPNDSNMVVLVEKATGTTSPNMGGFYFGTATRSGMRVLTKIIAHIPVGYKINWASNATGTGGKNYWATSQEGTGEFKEYIHVLECGTTGTFSSTAFFHISANDGVNTKAIKWGICYATVFDAYSNQSDWVNDALQNANNAQISANGVQSQVDEMASDNKLSPIEKQQTKKEWEIILAEYPQNIAKANTYSVSKTTYTNSYNTLKSYIEPLLSSLTTTSDIVGTTFRTNFKNYYDAEIKLTGDIYDKVKASAVADSKTYADGIDSKLTGYMSDGVLTPQEKGDLKSEVTTIETRATSLKSRASVFGVATTTLTSYVTKLTNWKNGVLSQAGIYNNLTQVNVLRTDFRNYYTEEEKVYDGIDKKAKELADKAQTDANGALGLLTDIASDNKFTPSEKQSTKKEWDIIVSEYTKNVDQAKVYGVTYTDYTNKYNALNTYITPLLSSLTTTSDIVGTTFRTNFKNYYDSRTSLLNAITTKAKELADKAQTDATTALGNAKIFHSTTAPTSGMKKNDMWYDTDDGNHPYIYNGSTWISARDKIFETEGGNKVYFQTGTPPTSGAGIKNGDMWFKTNENNKMFILINGVWTLADDALDKVNTGRIVLNGNTTVNGDFTVRGKNIELTGETRVNGVLEVYGGDKGIISYNGTTEANSTKRIIIRGGEIIFQERV